MSKRITSFIAAIFFNVISISLIFSILLIRADVIRAQSGSPKADDVALVPRSVEAAETADDDDDEGDADPPSDNDGYDRPPGEEDDIVVYTIRPGDTLWKIAARLGVPYAVLRAQDDTPSLIHPGQEFIYRPSDRVDSSIPLTDDDGTDSDGYDTPPPSTDFDGVSTPPPTDNDGLDSETGAVYGVAQVQRQVNQQQHDPYTDNDGTDSDGVATSQLTDNDGTDSDGIDTTGQQDDTDNSDTADSGLSS